MRVREGIAVYIKSRRGLGKRYRDTLLTKLNERKNHKIKIK